MQDIYAKVYLGDAVYAQFDKYSSVVLTTEDGRSTTNVIVLEPEVIQAFRLYVSELNKLIDAKGGRPI